MFIDAENKLFIQRLHVVIRMEAKLFLFSAASHARSSHHSAGLVLCPAVVEVWYSNRAYFVVDAENKPVCTGPLFHAPSLLPPTGIVNLGGNHYPKSAGSLQRQATSISTSQRCIPQSHGYRLELPRTALTSYPIQIGRAHV